MYHLCFAHKNDFLRLNWLQKPLWETNFHPFKSGAVPFFMSITLPLLSGEPSGFSLACIICVLLINMIRACSLLRLLLSACKSRELYFITFRVHKIMYENTNHSLQVVCSKLTNWVLNAQQGFAFIWYHWTKGCCLPCVAALRTQFTDWMKISTM